MLKAGKRTREWETRRAKLKVRFEAAGITRCEVRYTGCQGNYALSFAHYDKRRFLKGDQLDVAVLACIFNCHRLLESMPRQGMSAEVHRIIRERTCQP